MRFSDNVIKWITVLGIAICLLCQGCRPGPRDGLLEESAATLLAKGAECLAADSVDEALRYFSFAGNMYDDKMPREEKLASARGFNNAGYIYFFKRSDYGNAFDSYLSGLEIAESNGLDVLLPFLYTNLANIYSTYGDNENAGKYYRKGFHASLAAREYGMSAISFYNMALMAFNSDSYSEIRKETELFRRLEVSHDSIGRYILSIAEAGRLKKEGKLQEALDVLERGISFIPPRPERARYRASGAYMKSSLLEKTGRYREAIDAMDIVRRESEEPGGSDLRIGYLRHLSELYELSGNLDSAYVTINQYAALYDSIFSPKTFGDLKDMIRTREQKREAENARVLKKENSLMRVIFIMAVAIIIAFAVFAAVLVRQKRKLKGSYR